MATYIKPEAIKDGTLTVGKLGIDAMTESEKEQFLCKLGLGKIGVVSQKQTWASDYSGYTISDIVRGFIPQEFITRATMAGATYNDETGYFEANSLTDLTYEDMQKIMIESGGRPLSYNEIGKFKASSLNGRTALFPRIGNFQVAYANRTSLNAAFESNKVIESIDLDYDFAIAGYLSYIFFQCSSLQSVIINCQNTDSLNNAFYACLALRNVKLRKLKLSLSLEKSKFVTNESILYIINNEAATSAITVTLHADAYARAMADAQIQAALEAHPNISLASA